MVIDKLSVNRRVLFNAFNNAKMYSSSITNNNKLYRLTKKGVWYRLHIKRNIRILKYYDIL